MSKQSSFAALDDLWDSASSSNQFFNPVSLDSHAVPEPARRYLEHAIAPGTRLASAVRLRMHGEFRLKQWYPFTAEQVIRTDGEMLWKATVRIHGLPVSGSDQLIRGNGAMQWKLLGLFPLINASGPDVTRSAIGRIAGESVWLPSLLSRDDVSWTAPNAAQAHASLTLLGERTELTLAVADNGTLQSIQYRRWGNPEGGVFHRVAFGGVVEEERTFGGYTIPSRLRVGWHFGTPRFEPEGEFFRVTVDEATFR